MKTGVLVFLILIGFSPAHATGGVWCQVDDANISYEMSGVLSHGMPSRPFQMKGRLEFRDHSLQVANVGAISDVMDWWLRNKELKYSIYTEDFPGDYKTVELVFEGAYNEASDDGTFDGNYLVRVTTPAGEKTLSGKMSCGTE